MKKAILWVATLFFCLSLVMGLPVTYKGDLIIDGANGKDVEVKVVTNLETYTQTFSDNYSINVAGDENTTTTFYFWSTQVGTYTQPAQASIVTNNLTFTTLANGAACSVNNECSSNKCCSNSCASTCETKNTGGGSGGGGGGGGSSTPKKTIYAEEIVKPEPIESSTPETTTTSGVNETVEEPIIEEPAGTQQEVNETTEPIEEVLEGVSNIFKWILWGALILLALISILLIYLSNRKKESEPEGKDN